MLLVVDVGNTNIVLGVYEGKNLLHFWRISTNKNKTSDEFGMFIVNLFQYNKVELEEIEGVIISSVVPTVMYSLEHAISKYIGKRPMVIGPGIKTGINVKIDNPRELGADRIVNAVSALAHYGGPLIIIDFGTATTYDCITAKGEHIGGIICPGIKISGDALWQQAAKLPKVELSKPKHVIGKNTIDALKSGLIYGYIGQVDYLVERLKQEMQEPEAKVIATGGLASMIASESKTIQKTDRLLTLEGLRLIYEKNK